MIVLAIDPGPQESGWATWNGSEIGDSGVSSNEEVLAWLWHHPAHTAHGNVLVAIEMIRSYGMAVGASVFDTCVWVGRFQQCAVSSSKPVKLCYRTDVKLHICKSPKAKDANVRQALLDQIGPQGRKAAPGPTYGVRSHAWAALAVAVYAHDLEGTRAQGVAPF